eukprot:COSAG02_NODE_13186_length_1430_cov_1.214876_1_plen_149_part_00
MIFHARAVRAPVPRCVLTCSRRFTPATIGSDTGQQLACTHGSAAAPRLARAALLRGELGVSNLGAVAVAAPLARKGGDRATASRSAPHLLLRGRPSRAEMPLSRCATSILRERVARIAAPLACLCLALTALTQCVYVRVCVRVCPALL